MSERRIILLSLWALLLAFFVWTVRPVLSPIVLFLALVYLATPLFGTATYRRLVITLGTLTGLWLVHVAGTLLAPFLLGLVLAYIADPLVDRWERWGVRRTWGALGVVLLAGLVVAAAAILLIPLVLEQGRHFIEELPMMMQELVVWYRVQLEALAASPLPVIKDIPFERALEINSQDVRIFVGEQLRMLDPSWEAAIGLGRGLQTALTIAGYVVLTPVLTFYLLRDLHSIGEWVGRMVPRDQREEVLAFLDRYDTLLGEYLRGQLLVALFVGLTTGVAYWVVGFPNAVLLGVVAGIFNIVPYLGLVVSLVPALIIAVVTPPIWLSLVKVAGVVVLVQALEGYFLSPKIVGDRVGLHPVWVMLAILAFGSFFGITGLLLAIPIAVLIKLLIGNTLHAYRRSVYYRASGKVGDTEST